MVSFFQRLCRSQRLPGGGLTWVWRQATRTDSGGQREGRRVVWPWGRQGLNLRAAPLNLLNYNNLINLWASFTANLSLTEKVCRAFLLAIIEIPLQVRQLGQLGLVCTYTAQNERGEKRRERELMVSWKNIFLLLGRLVNLFLSLYNDYNKINRKQEYI